MAVIGLTFSQRITSYLESQAKKSVFTIFQKYAYLVGRNARRRAIISNPRFEQSNAF
jgi:hypothetical protein